MRFSARKAVAVFLVALLCSSQPAHASGSVKLIVIDIILLPVTFPFLIADAVHNRHRMSGCVSNTPQGLSIRSVDHRKDYLLIGNVAGIAAGSNYDLTGKRGKNAGGASTFEVRQASGYAACPVSSPVMSTP